MWGNDWSGISCCRGEIDRLLGGVRLPLMPGLVCCRDQELCVDVGCSGSCSPHEEWLGSALVRVLVQVSVGNE